MKDMVQMVALWDFSGPEGNASGMGAGLVRTGQQFSTTPERAAMLLSLGKARTVHALPTVDGPERTKPEAPEVVKADSFVYEDLTAAEVLERVEAEHLTPAHALELELARDPQRITLVAKLRKMMGG
jgi:hypothetical protein